MCHSHLCQGTFPSGSVPTGTEHTSGHSGLIPTAPVRSDTGAGPIPANDLEFHPLLVQAAFHKQGRAALQSDINPKASTLRGAEQLSSFLQEESSRWRGASVLRPPVLQGVQDVLPKRPQLKPHRAGSCSCCSLTGTNTQCLR